MKKQKFFLALWSVLLVCAMEQDEPKEVYLDRPFVYMLIDCENNIPFFMGTLTDLKI